MSIDNLDMKCAKAGHDMAGAGDDPITKSLGVLQEDVVYAFFLFCNAKEERHSIITKTIVFLKEVKWGDIALLPPDTSEQNIFDKLRDRYKDKLDDLLLAKDLLERALIYGRYHAKAKASGTSTSGHEGAAQTTEAGAPEGEIK